MDGIPAHQKVNQSEALLKPASNKPALLRQALRSGKTLAVPGAFNAITAKIIEKCGFEAVYISGAGLNNGVAGYPDIGFMTQTEMAQMAGYIARSVNIPAIADGDNGYGEAINVFRTVQEYERAGLSGIHLEDQVSPKRCGHLNGKQVISQEAMVEKVRAAVSARQNPDFLIIARIDSKAVYGYDDALARSKACLEAGADMIFPEALETPEEFAAFARDLKGPLLANMTEFGKTPYLTLQEFEAFGYNIVIYPMTGFRIMMKAVEDAMVELKQTGTQKQMLERMTSRQDLYQLIHYTEYESLDKTLVTQFSNHPV
jgi:methylisocitrate lyase